MADINDVLIQMNQGFADLHQAFDSRIDELRCDFTEHREPCMQRFHDIEMSMAVRAATNGAKAEAGAGARDLWKYVIRGTVLAMAIALGGIVWKLFVGHISLVAQ